MACRRKPRNKGTSSRNADDIATLSWQLDDETLNPLLLREGQGHGGGRDDGRGGNHGWVAMRLQ
jgi:hypothetical protein